MQALPSDMRSAVFKIVLKSGGATEYEQVKVRSRRARGSPPPPHPPPSPLFRKGYFDTATDNAEKKHVLNALGATNDPKLKMATIEWTCSGAVKLQDFFYTIGSVHRSNSEGMQMTWQ